MYNVVFEGSGKSDSNHLGIRTQTSFPSEAKFQLWKRNHLGSSIIIAEGISDEKALELVKQTTMAAYVASAMKEANGNAGILAMKLANVEFIAQLDGKEEELVIALRDAFQNYQESIC